MPKAIKIECYQSTANYRKPMAIDIQESYKLPPYSTVIGMIHNVCGFKEYHPMDVSIQGNHYSSFTDMYTRYFFGMKYDEGRHQAFVSREDGEKDGITRGLGYAQLLTDIHLIIHIRCESEDDMELVFQGLNNPIIYPALGRYEDLLQIQNIEIVELENCAELYLQNDTYVPIEIYKNTVQYEENNVEGTIYNLNKNYDKKKTEKLKTRYWNKIQAKYIAKSILIECDEKLLVKEKNSGIGVFFA